MADTIVQVDGVFDGMTDPTLFLFTPGGVDAALNGSGDILTKATNRETSWRATVDHAINGLVKYEVRVSGTAVASGYVYMLNDEQTYYCSDYGPGHLSDKHFQAVEGTLTPYQVLRLFISMFAGKVSGVDPTAETNTILFKAQDGTTTRVTVVTDNVGNRTTVTLDDLD